MSKYIIRLDDATDKYDRDKWGRIEFILDKYAIKPIVGIIPDCKDPFFDRYESDPEFWEKVSRWKDKGWTIAMHGHNHLYCTESGGINPVNQRSEFAGVPLDKQKEKINEGVKIMNAHGIEPKIFFAPSHTFDKNTLIALKENSSIRMISDTIANNVYTDGEFTYVPQQSGSVRKLPFKIITICFHPNTISDEAIEKLEKFIATNSAKLIAFPEEKTHRKLSAIDKILRKLYFFKKKLFA